MSYEDYFHQWLRIQTRVIEDLLISGAPYFDILEIITGDIQFNEGYAWYVAQKELQLH